MDITTTIINLMTAIILLIVAVISILEKLPNKGKPKSNKRQKANAKDSLFIKVFFLTVKLARFMLDNFCLLYGVTFLSLGIIPFLLPALDYKSVLLFATLSIALGFILLAIQSIFVIFNFKPSKNIKVIAKYTISN